MCHWGFFYKINGEEVKRISLFIVLLCCQNLVLLCFTCESWISSLRKSGSSSLQGKLGAIFFGFLCGPFAARGAKGEEEYP
jgi:hypothetical protein